jgi:hypothetical protein
MVRNRCLGLLCLALLSVAGKSQSKVVTHIIDPQSVEQVGTSLNHATVIALPEAVINAVIGSDAVRMEYRDNTVVLEPTEPGIKTNLFIFTSHYQLSYDVMPAQNNSEISYAIHEILAPPPPPPPGPTPAVAQIERDSMHAAFLMSIRTIAAPHYKDKRAGINMRIESVGKDKYSYYIRLSAVNRTSHLYRISTPEVQHIIPTFGARMAVSSVDEQLTQRKFNKVLLYQSEMYPSHGSTLLDHDLKPGEYAHWFMAISRRPQSPAMYQFRLPSDGDTQVSVVVVF